MATSSVRSGKSLLVVSTIPLATRSGYVMWVNTSPKDAALCRAFMRGDPAFVKWGASTHGPGDNFVVIQDDDD
jgi:hypothetical protein